ncbi:hypothetical protein P153DRAFT_148786 [Dothidotthia symphoricarpi CBS 119687]|uniref:Uncharacterized protein n=1 Tax=Dothidotthia symphoricarpi CBS 119687 TaxID=1392245 RepID=A0A6A5ZZ08_9PLEO|nr:uncharacterized protein P153DRAFT_148786 [Dothidotthia symphoricarpi CBS 119687]KAF2123648.1 hypothetical protein P153DRAFT_148786 [Dothidotthia symphoricarpi CBS 119687]
MAALGCWSWEGAASRLSASRSLRNAVMMRVSISWKACCACCTACCAKENFSRRSSISLSSSAARCIKSSARRCVSLSSCVMSGTVVLTGWLTGMSLGVRYWPSRSTGLTDCSASATNGAELGVSNRGNVVGSERGMGVGVVGKTAGVEGSSCNSPPRRSSTQSNGRLLGDWRHTRLAGRRLGVRKSSSMSSSGSCTPWSPRAVSTSGGSFWMCSSILQTPR